MRGSKSFYTGSDAVETMSAPGLRAALNEGGPILVEFYAPWCVHCQQLAPEYKKAAILLEDVARVGAVNCDEHEDLCQRHQIAHYPMIKLFWRKKQIEETCVPPRRGRPRRNGRPTRPTSCRYDGGHSADAIFEYVKRAKEVRVSKLTPSIFSERVLGSKQLWVVVFSAGPWCGPCSQAKPVVRQLASALQGMARVGTVNCDDHKDFCAGLHVPHYPQMRGFARGPKPASSEGVVIDLGGNPSQLPIAASARALEVVTKLALGWRDDVRERREPS